MLRAYLSMSTSICGISHGVDANSRACAASRSATKPMTSSTGSFRPSANAWMFSGTSAPAGFAAMAML